MYNNVKGVDMEYIQSQRDKKSSSLCSRQYKDASNQEKALLDENAGLLKQKIKQ